MPTPSLILVPARFKTGKLYTPVATTSGGLVLGASGDFNVTRATTATRFNSAGLIESVASGIPRLDYYTSGGTAGCPALLIEPDATNGAPNVGYLRGPGLATASGGPTITTGSTDFLAPDGTSGSITKYVGGAASGAVQNAFYTGLAPTISAAGAYTFSLFVKAGATNPLNFCALQFTQYAGGTGTATSYFSLASGTALTTGASIQNYGNGWYRLISPPFTIAAGDLTGNVLFNLAEGNNDITWPASGALNLTAYAWGAQIEAGSVATSYIPTNTAAVTRNADAVNLSSVSGVIGQTEGTIYFEYYHNTASNAGIRNAFNLEGNVGSVFNGINFATSNNGNDLQVAVQVSGSSVVSGGAFSTSVSEGWHKVAFGYNAATSGTSFYFDGNLIATRTLTSIPAMSRIALMARSNPFSGFDLDRQFNNRIRAAALYTTRLTNAELAALTTP
jgi:hypothetical protein